MNVQKERNIHKEQCYSATKNALLLEVTEWMELEMLVFCEMRKAQQAKHCMTSIICGIVRVDLIGVGSEIMVVGRG